MLMIIQAGQARLVCTAPLDSQERLGHQGSTALLDPLVLPVILEAADFKAFPVLLDTQVDFIIAPMICSCSC